MSLPKCWVFGRVAKVVTLDLRGSTAVFYKGKWSKFLLWCHGQNLFPCNATVQQIAEFFLCLRRELKLLVFTVKGYHIALNHVFSLASVYLMANYIISMMFCSFEKAFPPCEVKPLEWNGTFLWFYGALLVCLMSPLNCPWISTLPGRCTSYLFLHQPRGLVSYMASLSTFSIHRVGDPVLFPTFQTLSPRL